MKVSGIIAALAATAAAAPTKCERSYGQDLCCAVNAQRAAAGKNLIPYLWSPELDAIAQGHSDYMLKNETLGNTEGEPGSATYLTSDRLNNAGFAFKSTGGGTLNGFDTVDSAVTAMINSPTTHQAVLSTEYTVCGAAIANPGSYLDVIFVLPDSNVQYSTLDCSGSTVSSAL